MPTLSDLVGGNEHYAEWFVFRDEAFMGTVEAAMRAVAVEIAREPAATPGHERRAQIALNIANSDTSVNSEARRFRNIFATVILQHEQLRTQFFDKTEPASTTRTMESRIRPWKMNEALLHSVIRGAWNDAAGIESGA